MSSNRIPEFRYRSSLIFGDSNWHHIVDLGQLRLSESDPRSFYIGDTVIPSVYESPTKLKSNWLWRFGFASSSSGRYYGTSTGSNGSTSITGLNVGVTSTSDYYSVGKGNIVEEAYRTEGTNIVKSSIGTIRFGTYTSWYFTPAQSTTPAASNRAIACRFSAIYEADLPSDMYTISGTSVVWNELHPIYILLYGMRCTPY